MKLPEYLTAVAAAESAGELRELRELAQDDPELNRAQRSKVECAIEKKFVTKICRRKRS